MSVQQMKDTARTFYDKVLSAGDLDELDRYLDPGFVDHNPFPDQPPGVAGVKQIFADMQAGFPDLSFTVNDMVAEDNTVVARISVKGTHKGTYMGVPPTGKQVKIDGIDVLRFADGRVAERWGQFDDLAMLQQLGLVPELGASS
jgi:steroid delta-isomerase-like uncharacterized protein